MKIHPNLFSVSLYLWLLIIRPRHIRQRNLQQQLPTDTGHCHPIASGSRCPLPVGKGSLQSLKSLAVVPLADSLSRPPLHQS